MENILLTGGFGFTGSHLINHFQKMNFQIIVFSNRNIVNPIILDKSNIIFESGDIRDSNRFHEVMKKYRPSYVIHLAALTGITKCQNDPFTAFLTNVYGTYDVIKGCIETNSYLIFISSREVYGETNNIESSEDDNKIPNNIYGMTKLEAENLILWANKKYNLNYTILRPTNLYGHGGDTYGAQILIKKILEEKDVEILGGKQRMNFIFVGDVIDSIIKVINNDQSKNEIFNVGSNDTLSILEFIELVTKLTNKKPLLKFLPMRNGETKNFHVSIEKIQKKLNWKPSTQIKDGLLKTINWYKNS